jgi:hypothetical protein
MRKATQDEGYGAAGGSMFLNGSISMELASAERRSRPHGVDEGLTVLAGSEGQRAGESRQSTTAAATAIAAARSGLTWALRVTTKRTEDEDDND